MLDHATNGALDVKLLRFQCALSKEDMAGAESILSELKQLYPLNTNVILAEAILFSAGGGRSNLCLF